MSNEKKLSDLKLGASLSRLGINSRGRTGSGSGLTRLNSLKPARDLTLGSAPKRTFVPNLPARRIVKDEPASDKPEASSSKEGRGKRNRERARDKPRGRGRGRGELITSQSIFSQGPFAVARSVGEAATKSSYSSKRDSSNRDVKGRTSAIIERKGDVESSEESLKVLDMLSDSGRIDIDGDELRSGCLMPITVPLAHPKLYDASPKDVAQEKASLEATAMHSKVKFEASEDVEMTEVDKGLPAPSTSQYTRQKTCEQLFSSCSADEKLLFLQFPDALPIKPLSHEPNTSHESEQQSTSSSVITEEDSQKFAFRNVSEGYIGKLVVHKSGRVRMVLGNASLDVEMGTPCGFLQDLMAIHLENDRQEMVCLGHIDHKVICVPDYEQLLGSAAS